MSAPGASTSSAAGRPIGASVTKRLQSELMALMLEGAPGVSAFPAGEDLLTWRGTICGSEDTVYAGMRFQLTLRFPTDYPYAPPQVQFATRCFHPNVDYASGAICLDILKEQWSSTYTVRTILLSIQSLLGEPNNDSPLNGHAASLWDADADEYRRVCVSKYEEATGEKVGAATAATTMAAPCLKAEATPSTDAATDDAAHATPRRESPTAAARAP